MKLNKYILTLFVTLSLMTGVAQASALTQGQINAIIGLLQAFGVNQTTVTDVLTELSPQLSTSTVAFSTTLPEAQNKPWLSQEPTSTYVSYTPTYSLPQYSQPATVESTIPVQPTTTESQYSQFYTNLANDPIDTGSDISVVLVSKTATTTTGLIASSSMLWMGSYVSGTYTGSVPACEITGYIAPHTEAILLTGIGFNDQLLFSATATTTIDQIVPGSCNQTFQVSINISPDENNDVILEYPYGTAASGGITLYSNKI
jgi:hypothetical protein